MTIVRILAEGRKLSEVLERGRIAHADHAALFAVHGLGRIKQFAIRRKCPVPVEPAAIGRPDRARHPAGCEIDLATANPDLLEGHQTIMITGIDRNTVRQKCRRRERDLTAAKVGLRKYETLRGLICRIDIAAATNKELGGSIRTRLIAAQRALCARPVARRSTHPTLVDVVRSGACAQGAHADYTAGAKLRSPRFKPPFSNWRAQRAMRPAAGSALFLSQPSAERNLDHIRVTTSDRIRRALGETDGSPLPLNGRTPAKRLTVARQRMQPYNICRRPCRPADHSSARRSTATYGAGLRHGSRSIDQRQTVIGKLRCCPVHSEAREQSSRRACSAALHDGSRPGQHL